jgi:hypothetical protein
MVIVIVIVIRDCDRHRHCQCHRTEGHRRQHHANVCGGQQNCVGGVVEPQQQNRTTTRVFYWEHRQTTHDTTTNNNNKLAVDLAARNQPQQRQHIVCGFLTLMEMTIWNPLCHCSLAMNYASPSIAAPFSGLTLVWIDTIFSDMLIGERPSCMQIIAASLIVLGEVVVAIFGDHTNDSGMTTLSDLEQSYREPVFLAILNYHYTLDGVFVGLLGWITVTPPSSNNSHWACLEDS